MNDTTPTLPPTTAPRKRGTIIVDSSAMQYLTLPSKQKFLGERPDDAPRYSDLLIFLSRHGYDIVFPEIIAFECADIFHDGQCTDKFFVRKTSLPVRSQNKVFFREVVSGIHPNIHILPTPDKAVSEAAEYMRTLRGIYDSTNPDIIKRRLIRDLKHEHAHRDLGKIGTADLIHNTALARPIIYLSNDKNSFRMVAEAMPANVSLGHLTIAGFLQALHERGLLDQGQRRSTDEHPVLSIMDDMRQNEVNLSHNKDSILLTTIDDIGRGRSGRPFFVSLGGIKEELEAEKAAASAVATEHSTGGPSQVEKFKRRLEKILPHPPGHNR